MRIATCFSGEARLLDEPCTTRATFDRVVVPLRLELFIALNAPTVHAVQLAGARLLSILAQYRPSLVVRLFDIEVFNANALSKTTNYCSEHDRLGREQAHGLVRCSTSIFAQATMYDWVVRLRTDVYVPYVISSLPSPRRMGMRIVVDYVGNWCMPGTARWTDDRMALLPQPQTQRAYLLGYAHDFCRRPTKDPGWRPPECKLGWTLGTRNITPVGLGGSWRRRIRHVRPVVNVCTTLGPNNHHPTHPWPIWSEILHANDILLRFESPRQNVVQYSKAWSMLRDTATNLRG